MQTKAWCTVNESIMAHNNIYNNITMINIIIKANVEQEMRAVWDWRGSKKF